MAVEATITGWRGSKTPSIRFEDQDVGFADASDPNSFPGLSDADELQLYIDTGNLARSVCDVQDAMFAYFSHIGPDHHLRTLDIHIDVSMPQDQDGTYSIFTSNYAEVLFKQNIMREFRGIRPGNLSRPHLTAFLTDPLRTIRSLHDGNKKGKLTLKYTGETGHPWKEIRTAVRELVLSDQVVPNYQIFIAYFTNLRPLLEAAEWLSRTASPATFNRVEQLASTLASSRIRADLHGFHAAHKALAEVLEGFVRKQLDFSDAAHYDSIQECEWKLREVMYLLPELEAALPAREVDVSGFGYNEIDRKLREWKDGSGDRRAAAKRKREEKDGQGGKKKGSGGGGAGQRRSVAF
ncbi:hypothetical protein LTR36_002799 [Oleoguttula mirabilis]|uniref:Uncharacterized protein n=1 Tax=Oleoguttula mirabilis TaxID=1507867 RepID=A0AAV9JJ47_9PEZI|nr:hypothetical protein LTR36_002799 [Oleoguttula mirabilis]